MKKNYYMQLLLVFITTILYFMANLQRTAVPGSIFDCLQSDLKVDAVAITSFGAIFTYFYALSQFLAGILVAKYGGFKVICAGATVFTIGCLIFPFAHSLLFLYMSRGLVGLGAATFYIGMIQECQKIISGKNFSLVLSFVLFIGYIGGIVAGAPLVVGIQKMGWRNFFGIIGLITLFICLIFVICRQFIHVQKSDNNTPFCVDSFRKILSNKENLYIYIFGCINYSIYFVLQTVIGKKFLEDFVSFSAIQAAVIVSVMSTIYAFSGSVLAFFSRIMHNRRTIFLKLAAINTLFVMILISLAVFIKLKTFIIPFLVCELACFASLSPILIPIIYDRNDEKTASVSISIMASLFFLIVSLISNVSGFVLNLIPPQILENGFMQYPALSYLRIFLFLTFIAFISLICSLKITETKKYKRFLKIYVNKD